MTIANRTLIILAFAAFVSLGLPDGVLGVAWPSMRGNFGRPLADLSLLLLGSTSGYLTSSFLAANILRRTSLGNLLAGSCLLVACAMLAQSLAPLWWIMPVLAVFGGLGAGAIDAGINAFAAHRFSPRITNWLHASWGVGAATGPLVMTVVLAQGCVWRWGYVILGAALLIMSLLLFRTREYWRLEPGVAGHVDQEKVFQTAIRSRAVRLQVLLFFLYTGLEATAGNLLYTVFTEGRGLSLDVAGPLCSAYWAAISAGRVFFGQAASRAGGNAVLWTGLLLSPIAAAMVWLASSPAIYGAALVVLGFAYAPIFPTLISLTPNRVGRSLAAQSISFQVAAGALGIMVFPAVSGYLAQRFGIELIPFYLTFGGALLAAANALSNRGELKEAGGRFSNIKPSNR